MTEAMARRKQLIEQATEYSKAVSDFENLNQYGERMRAAVATVGVAKDVQIIVAKYLNDYMDQAVASARKKLEERVSEAWKRLMAAERGELVPAISLVQAVEPKTDKLVAPRRTDAP